MRRFLPAVLAVALVSVTCTSSDGPESQPGSPTFGAMAAELGTDVVEQLIRGYVPGRSGEISLVTPPWTTVAQWPGGLRSRRDPRTTHASPWAYLARVPIILHGPGYVRPGVRSERSVDVADLAPTFAELLGFDFRAPDGTVLREALLPRKQRKPPPRLVVLVVQDGGGWNVLERWPRAWPTQRRLAMEGTTYLNATVGSAPPVTASVHATMGTGAYPRTHGLPENTGRLPDGSLGELYFHQADPRLLRAETLADAWDRDNGNRPWVGLLGYDTWHLGMMGKGAQAEGGDRDVAVLWGPKDPSDSEKNTRFWSNEDVYALPPYLPGPEDLDQELRQLDIGDGAGDGRWLDNDLEDSLLVPGTPAFVRHQRKVLLEMVRREPIGRDRVTDFLFVELKPSDTAGHLWNMLSGEVRQVLEAQDRVLEDLVALLDERVGRGSYVMAVTADHGQVPFPSTTGGLRVDRFRMLDRLEERFGEGIVEAVHPDDLYLNVDAVQDAGITVEDVARYVATLRYRDVAPEGTDVEKLPPRIANRRVFTAALPGKFLMGLSAAEVRDLGPGTFRRHADLSSPPRIRSLPG